MINKKEKIQKTKNKRYVAEFSTIWGQNPRKIKFDIFSHIEGALAKNEIFDV